ncbi:MAG: porin [Syntrophaceae bacterium]
MRSAILTFLLFVCCAALDALAREIEILPTGETLIVTEPGRIVTSAVKVTNHTQTSQEFSLEAGLPDPWILITQGYPFVLDKDGSEVQLISFLVPRGALAGNYPVSYTVKGVTSPSLSDTSTVHVIVLPVTRLSLRVKETPRYVVAGDNCGVTFVVANESNIRQEVHVEVESPQPFPLSLEASDFALEAGESRVIAVRSQTDKNIPEAMLHTVRLRVQIPGKKETEVETESSVEIVPRTTGTEGRYHTLPTELTARYVSNTVGDHSESGFQGQLSGNGTIDEDGKKHVTFLFKGPDLYKKSDLGSTTYRARDEYRLNLWTERYEFMFGDQSYSLSPLTEVSLYGRGAGGKLNFDRMQLGGYRVQTRWFDPEQDQTALFTKYDLNENMNIGLNYLRKDNLDGSSTITSIASRITPIQATSVNLEFARGSAQKSDDTAYALDILGNQELMAYALNYIHAEPDYPGSYRDMDFLTAGVTIPVRERLRLSANFRQDKRNLDLDPSKSSANMERVYQAGMNYRLDPGMNLGLDVRTRDFEDRLPDPQFDYTETTTRISFSKGMDRLNVYSSAQIGTVRDRLDNTRQNTENYALSAYLSPFTNQTYSGYIYYDKNRPEEGGLQTCRTLGVSSAFRLGDATRLDLHYESRDYRNSSTGKQNIYEFQIAQTLFKNHQVSFQGRYMTNRHSLQENESAYMIEYTIPFDLPVSKVERYGTVKGSLNNVETNEAIANALIRLNGISTITDKKGEFTFNMIKPGNYYIDVDSASIGLDKISAQKTPIKISVQGGEISTLKLGVTRAAALAGRVMAYRIDSAPPSSESTGTKALNFIMDPNGGHGIVASGEDAKLVEASGLASVVVELRSGSESLCRITDKQGRFAFEELRPGTWTIIVDETNLPANYAVADKELRYELSPGQTRDVIIQVAPVKRTVQIVEERELTIEKPTSGEARPKHTIPTATEPPGDKAPDMIRRQAELSAPAAPGLVPAEPRESHEDRIAGTRMPAAKQEQVASAVSQGPSKSTVAEPSKDGTRLPRAKPEKHSRKWLGLASSLILCLALLALVCRKLIRSGKNR